VGNRGACAEFNIRNDPEAARIVFDSGGKVNSPAFFVQNANAFFFQKEHAFFLQKARSFFSKIRPNNLLDKTCGAFR